MRERWLGWVGGRGERPSEAKSKARSKTADRSVRSTRVVLFDRQAKRFVFQVHYQASAQVAPLDSAISQAWGGHDHDPQRKDSNWNGSVVVGGSGPGGLGGEPAPGGGAGSDSNGGADPRLRGSRAGACTADRRGCESRSDH